MESKEKKKFIKLRWRLAQEKLKFAKILLKKGGYRDAISRAYYAMFYASRAVLLANGEDPHSHKGVKIFLHKFCAEHENIGPNFARMFSLVQEARLDADYKEKVTITKNDAQETIDLTAAFLKKMKDWI